MEPQPIQEPLQQVASNLHQANTMKSCEGPENTVELERLRIEILGGNNQLSKRIIGIPKRYYGKVMPDTEIAKQIKKDFDNGENLFLHGISGSGKTHIAICLLLNYFSKNIYLNSGKIEVKANKRPEFLPVSELFFKLKQSYHESEKITDTEIIDKYSDINLLCLDDFCSERASGWTRDIFNLIITRRYNNMKRTIMTSNKNIQEVGTIYDDRIASRICEMGNIIEMPEIDYRVLGKHKK